MFNLCTILCMFVLLTVPLESKNFPPILAQYMTGCNAYSFMSKNMRA